MKEMTTDRLIIRRFIPEDWEDLYEYLSLPDVVKYEPYDVFTKDHCVLEVMERHEAKEKSVFWAVCLKNSKKMIGHLYFAQNEPAEFMTWQLGYVFNPNYYGKGYATEACKRILQYGFEECYAHRIVAQLNVKNSASWRLLERLSMRRESHMIQNVFFKRTSDGEPIWNDSYSYAITSSEWHDKD